MKRLTIPHILVPVLTIFSMVLAPSQGQAQRRYPVRPYYVYRAPVYRAPVYYGYNPYRAAHWYYRPHYWYYRPYYGYGFGYPAYNYPVYTFPNYYSPLYYSPNYYLAYPPSNLPPPLAPSGPQNIPGEYSLPTKTPAYIDVRLPTPEAEVWFEGNKTDQVGVVRSFVSPPLTPGTSYTYRIRAQWYDGHIPYDQSRTVTVQAGQYVTVDFTRPAAPEKLRKAPPPAK